MPVKELVMELPKVEDKPKTFKAATEPRFRYHYLQRVVGPQALPDGTISGDTLDVEVERYLNDGYEISHTEYYGDHKGQGGEFLGRVVAYHFIKDSQKQG